MEFIQDLAAVWPGYCAVASMVPNVTFLILNGLFGHRYNNRLSSLKVNWASTLSSRIHDILVRIRIPGSVPLTKGSGSGSNSGSDSFLH
jgi:hypothetical protein